MDDLISKKALLEAYDNAHKGPPGGARKLIEEAPEAIVRCKDCRHYLLLENESRGQCMVRAGWFPVDADWFCADGERKET